MYQMCSYVDIPGRAQGSTAFREVRLRHAHYSTWPCLAHEPWPRKRKSTAGNSKRETNWHSFKLIRSHSYSVVTKSKAPREIYLRGRILPQILRTDQKCDPARHDPVSAMSRWHRRFTQENATALKGCRARLPTWLRRKQYDVTTVDVSTAYVFARFRNPSTKNWDLSTK